jgi:triacylglycerol lipase
MSTEEARTNPAQTWPERGVSILNGMLGDYLQRRGNELAIAMSFRHRGEVLALGAAALRAATSPLSHKLCVFVHGFCCNESVWNFPAEGERGSYGTRLQRDEGLTPFFVRYNTGLPVAESGMHLARLLQNLTTAYPLAIDEITLIGHSMGGLVIRRACDPGHPNAGWLKRVKRVFYIGTPHDGAALERFAQFTTRTLQSLPSEITRLVGDILNLRSRGVKDLAAGATVDGESPPWLASARHYLLMGTLTRDPDHPVARLFGDSLVRAPRGTGAAAAPDAPEIVILPGVHHVALAHDPSVYRRIRQICADT